MQGEFVAAVRTRVLRRSSAVCGAIIGIACTAACAGGSSDSDADDESGPNLSDVGTDATLTASTSDAATTVAATGDGGTSSAETTATDPDSGDADTGSCEEVLWYLDGDGDGRGDPTMTVSACEPPDGYVPFGDDCDDADPLVTVGDPEICDGIDNDCDGATDEAAPGNDACNGCTLFAAGGRSYGFCPAGASWADGRIACAAFGGDLLRIDDDAEHAAVVDLPAPPGAVPGGWFIGLSDVALRGTFVWVDGGALDFTAWNPAEPNDAAGDEDCVEMDPAAGGWNDVPCSSARPFICESGGA